MMDRRSFFRGLFVGAGLGVTAVLGAGRQRPPGLPAIDPSEPIAWTVRQRSYVPATWHDGRLYYVSASAEGTPFDPFEWDEGPTFQGVPFLVSRLDAP